MPRKKRKTATRKASRQDRLVITETPAVDLEPDSPVALLPEEFHKAHIAGMAALAKHDFQTLSDAIMRERKIIDAQKRLITSVSRTEAARKRSRKR